MFRKFNMFYRDQEPTLFTLNKVEIPSLFYPRDDNVLGISGLTSISLSQVSGTNIIEIQATGIGYTNWKFNYNGSAYENATSNPHSLTAPFDYGNYVINAYAVDEIGNQIGNSVSSSITLIEVDSTPPTATVSLTVSYEIKIQITDISETNTTIRVEDLADYSVLYGPTNIGQNTSQNINLPYRPTGDYTYRVYVVDSYGNENFYTRSFTIEDVGIRTGTINYIDGDDYFTATGTSTKNDIYDVLVYLDGSVVYSSGLFEPGVNNFTTPNILTPTTSGTYSYNTVVGGDSFIGTLTIDKTPPTYTLNISTEAQYAIGGGGTFTVYFEFTNLVEDVRISIRDSPFTTTYMDDELVNTTTFTKTINVPDTTDKSYTITVSDLIGNSVSETRLVQFTDTTEPTADISREFVYNTPESPTDYNRFKIIVANITDENDVKIELKTSAGQLLEQTDYISDTTYTFIREAPPTSTETLSYIVKLTDFYTNINNYTKSVSPQLIIDDFTITSEEDSDGKYDVTINVYGFLLELGWNVDFGGTIYNGTGHTLTIYGISPDTYNVSIDSVSKDVVLESYSVDTEPPTYSLNVVSKVSDGTNYTVDFEFTDLTEDVRISIRDSPSNITYMDDELVNTNPNPFTKTISVPDDTTINYLITVADINGNEATETRATYYYPLTSPDIETTTLGQDTTNILSKASEGTIRITGVFTTATKGIFYEAGGTSRGLTIYSYIAGDNTTIYCRAGNGSGDGDPAYQCSYTISNGETITEIVYVLKGDYINTNTGASKLYINGSLKDEASGSVDQDIGGSNISGFGNKYGTIPEVKLDDVDFPLPEDTFLKGEVWNSTVGI